MEPIPVKPHPFRQTFDSADQAILHAMSHPLRSMVETDAEQLRDTTLADAYWSFSDVVLEFSNERWLHIFVSDAEVRWRLNDSQVVLSAEPQFRVGAPAVELDWQGTVGADALGVSTLVTKRIGAEFKRLFINHTGFFVYFDGHLVFQFHAAYRTDTDEDILYVIEGD